MRHHFFKVRPRILWGFMAGMAVVLSFAGLKKSGKAVVLEKEHLVAREVTPTPRTEQTASPRELTTSLNASASNEEEKPRELRKDEIVVDTYVMKEDMRGTRQDPRAMSDEQWIEEDPNA